jgi:hypothetical protein
MIKIEPNVITNNSLTFIHRKIQSWNHIEEGKKKHKKLITLYMNSTKNMSVAL